MFPSEWVTVGAGIGTDLVLYWGTDRALGWMGANILYHEIIFLHSSFYEFGLNTLYNYCI